jgi:multiple sugar transport system permease protein
MQGLKFKLKTKLQYISNTQLGQLLLLPALLIITLVAFYPIIRCFWISFFEKRAGKEAEFILFQNYLTAIYDNEFHNSFLNTIIFTSISVVFEFLLGLIFALMLHEVFRGRGLVRAATIVPWALPPAVMAMAWRWIFNDTYGVFGDVLMKLGIIKESIAWLGEPTLAMFSVIFADVWKTTPFVCIILLAGLQTIPKDLYEASSIDGAGYFKQFWMITLPLLRPYIVLALLFRSIQAFAVFDHIWVLTEGGPAGTTQTVSIYIYDTVFRYLKFGYSATLSIIIFIFLGICAFITTKFIRQKVEF